MTLSDILKQFLMIFCYQSSSEKLPPTADGNRCRDPWLYIKQRVRKTLKHIVLIGISLSNPSTQNSGNHKEKKAESMEEPEELEKKKNKAH